MTFFSGALPAVEPPSFSPPGGPAAKRPRVIIASDPSAVRAFQPDDARVSTLFSHALLKWTGKKTPREAWATLVSPRDVVGIKVYSAPGGLGGTRVGTAAAVVESLLAGGVVATNIVIWDKRLADLERAGFGMLRRRFGVEVRGAAEEGYDESVFYESPIIGNLVWGDLEFGRKGEGLGRRSYMSRLLTHRITRHVVISPLLNHNLAGTTGHLYQLALGSVDNTLRFELQGDRLAAAVPEIFAMSQLSDRLALAVTDGLVCQYRGEQRAMLHYATSPGELWLSHDPVALDVMAAAEIRREREAVSVSEPAVPVGAELYDNAALLELGSNEPKGASVERCGPPWR